MGIKSIRSSTSSLVLDSSSHRLTVAVGIGVAVGIEVGVGLGVAVGINVGVAVGVMVGAAEMDGVGVAVGTPTGVTVGVDGGTSVPGVGSVGSLQDFAKINTASMKSTSAPRPMLPKRNTFFVSFCLVAAGVTS